MKRGLDRNLATEVAKTMTAKDALEAHLRDELGQFPQTKARPVQASIASALSFTAGGLIPFAGALAPTPGTKVVSIIVFTLAGLIGTGVLSARIAGSSYLKTTVRILIGGSLGMVITAGIGSLVHLTGI
jgi:VIT1/CCC1 family predicted Fe2+/Mn2+ transporter